MNSLSQLETYANELAAVAKTLAGYCHDTGAGSTPHLAIPRDAPVGIHRARRNALSIIARLHVLLAEPADLIQQLSKQHQLLACLQWLGEFQVLAYIRPNSSVPIKDVADLASVSETQLCRVVRMTATAGFLHEPEPGHVAHTALSEPFVTKLSFLDAVMFLAETAAPVALQMAAATKRYRYPDSPSESAYALVFNTSQTFQFRCEQSSKLQRQWSAYLRCVGEMSDNAIELLGQLDWHSLGNACIVDVGADSTGTAAALARLYPTLQFIVQMSNLATSNGAFGAENAREPSLRIAVQPRASGATQTVKDATVYILRLPRPSPEETSHSLIPRMVTELRAHLGMLRMNPTAVTIVLVSGLLPEPGSADPHIEAMARMLDLSRLQLANEREMEMKELVEVVNSVHDSTGSLVVANQLRSRNTAMMALGVKYQAHPEKHHEPEPTIVR